MRYLVCLLLPGFAFAQVGPNSPDVGANVTGIGTLTWSNTGNIISSNDNDASQNTRGTTNYLQGTDYDFNLAATDIVSGIRLEIERASNNVNNVTLLNDWSVGTTRSRPNGANRCLIVIIGLENATTRDITSVTYGGRPLTAIADIGLATPFYARTEAWYLLESDIAAATNTTISFTYGAGTPSENFEIISAAMYANVDQFSPFFDTEVGSTSSTNDNFQLPNPLSVSVGSMAITGIFCGNPPDPIPNDEGDANGFTINQSFGEEVDYYKYRNGYETSGGQLQIAQRAITTAGTVQPTFSFDGDPNRRTVVALCLRRARQMDNSVRIKKAAGFVGNDKAAAGVEWPTADAYATYGGAGDLWGTTWTVGDINNTGFGGAISTIIQNGTATVDHMRISVFTSSVLPLELVSFGAEQQGTGVLCSWITATERNTDVFVIERSTDGIHFEAIGTLKAAGNSESVLQYQFRDEQPAAGINYYRLTTIDTDGSQSDSDIVSATFEQAATVTVYPNPTNGWASVLTPEGFDEIVITDLQGHVVDRFEGTNLDNQQELNLYDMPDGAYFVCVKSHNGTVEIKKLVKTSREQ